MHRGDAARRRSCSSSRKSSTAERRKRASSLPVQDGLNDLDSGFYLGQSALGVAKLLTFGACGVWYVIDWLLIMGVADKENLQTLQQLKAMYPSASSAQQTAVAS